MLYNTIAESILESEKSVNIVLDTDFLGAQMNQAEMTSLFNGYISGAIDLDTLIYNLRTGQRLNPDSSDEDVAAAIEKRASDIAAKQKANQPEPNTPEE